MFSRTHSVSTTGQTLHITDVEITASGGLPKFVIIGLASKTVSESRERITTVLTQAGIRLPHKRVVINLAPAELKKSGSTLEFAIAVGLLKLLGVALEENNKTIYLGELSLDGSLKKIANASKLILFAQTQGYTNFVIPQENYVELSQIQGVTLHPLESVANYMQHCRSQTPLPTFTPSDQKNQKNSPSFTTVKGQAIAKRALSIAVAGKHHLLMIGPPGNGKTMLAQAAKELLPPTAPFRAPHQSCSQTTLIGTERSSQPGELSLAHSGILFLDELPEFSKKNLVALRQPMEATILSLTASKPAPCDFTLLAAMNPCQCGFKNSTKKTCTCTRHQLNLYSKKIDGPLKDRFSLQVYVPALSPEELQNTHQNFSEATLDQLKKDVARTSAQLTQHKKTAPTSQLFLPLSDAASKLLYKANSKLYLSARRYHNCKKVAQTIALLDGKKSILADHIAEALQFRIQ